MFLSTRFLLRLPVQEEVCMQENFSLSSFPLFRSSGHVISMLMSYNRDREWKRVKAGKFRLCFAPIQNHWRKPSIWWCRWGELCATSFRGLLANTSIEGTLMVFIIRSLLTKFCALPCSAIFLYGPTGAMLKFNPRRPSWHSSLTVAFVRDGNQHKEQCMERNRATISSAQHYLHSSAEICFIFYVVHIPLCKHL